MYRGIGSRLVDQEEKGRCWPDRRRSRVLGPGGDVGRDIA